MSQRLQAIAHANLLHSNQVALKLLPCDWHDDSALHILTLALWGITERGINVELPGGRITGEQIGATILAMGAWDPDTVMMFVEGGVDDELALCLDPEEGAERNARGVLEAIRDQVIAYAP